MLCGEKRKGDGVWKWEEVENKQSVIYMREFWDRFMELQLEPASSNPFSVRCPLREPLDEDDHGENNKSAESQNEQLVES